MSNKANELINNYENKHFDGVDKGRMYNQNIDQVNAYNSINLVNGTNITSAMNESGISHETYEYIYNFYNQISSTDKDNKSSNMIDISNEEDFCKTIKDNENPMYATSCQNFYDRLDAEYYRKKAANKYNINIIEDDATINANKRMNNFTNLDISVVNNSCANIDMNLTNYGANFVMNGNNMNVSRNLEIEGQNKMNLQKIMNEEYLKKINNSLLYDEDAEYISFDSTCANAEVKETASNITQVKRRKNKAELKQDEYIIANYSRHNYFIRKRKKKY